MKLENYANQIANIFREKFHLVKGDCVVLLMENRPEFVGIWYGLSKLGVVTALVNTNLRNKVLVHSIQAANPKVIIYDEELEQAILQIRGDIGLEMNLIRQGLTRPSSSNVPVLENLQSTTSKFFEQTETIVGKDILMYIYTSGTTGLPKPAIIKVSFKVVFFCSRREIILWW